MCLDWVFSQFGSKIFADVSYIFENENDIVNSVIWRTVIMISIGQVLEKG